MGTRDIYLKIEVISDYCPVDPDPHALPPRVYRRDCMRNMGHEDGLIPVDEVGARRLSALVYREYLDPDYLIPKPDKIVPADINEPLYDRRVPGTVIHAEPGDRLRIHVKNADRMPHSFHLHGLRYGIDSDGSWPLGTQAADGRRSDEICPGESWTYTFDVTPDMVGAWPFHDHYRDIGASVNRGLFGGVIVSPAGEADAHEPFPRPRVLDVILERLRTHPPRPDPPPWAGAPVTAAPGHGHAAPAAPAHGAAGHAAAGHAAAGHAVPMPHGGEHDHGGAAGHGHAAGPERRIPSDVRVALSILEELAHVPRAHPPHKPPRTIHVPIFLHQMTGPRGTPVFRSARLQPGAQFAPPPFTQLGEYAYYCEIHGLPMSGIVRVQAQGPMQQAVTIVDNQFIQPDVTVGVGGSVVWTNNGPSTHTVTERGGASLVSYCMNGRAFVGNTPTIEARAGQRIRWYVFNLDLAMGWHNFHTHAMRWRFAGETIDGRSLGPAESFVIDTIAPPVLLLPPAIEATQAHPPHGAHRYELRGDFLFHCHVEMHMMQGLAGLVRSTQPVWLTTAQRAELEQTTGLPIDPGGNDCAPVDLDRCANAESGIWQTVPGLPEVAMMHAVLLPGTQRVLYWGYGPRNDQSRLWDPVLGYRSPANQPFDLFADQNLWSGTQAILADGKLLIHGGFAIDVTSTADTERRAFLFDPVNSAWSAAPPTAARRFYPTALSLGDGRVLSLYGADTWVGVSSSYEIYTPGGGGGAWAPAVTLPFDYMYYPWTFLLPGGDLFIAGPQVPSRRFYPLAVPIVDDPSKQWSMIAGQRGENMDGSAVLLPLRPPGYGVRVIAVGGGGPAAEQSSEWIDLEASPPAWQALGPLALRRGKLNAVLLPDGRVMVAGGATDPMGDGGPVEIFDPSDPALGWQSGPRMTYHRDYHSAALLLPDGSVLMGGDPGDGMGPTPHERYLPSYFFRPRPSIAGAPAAIAYGAAFSVGSPQARAIAEVVLMRPGAVTHGFNMQQRWIGCTITSASATSVAAVAPPDGNVAPPGPYLLFLLDRDRIPSEAVWIQVGP